jgi:hypothetical protein
MALTPRSQRSLMSRLPPKKEDDLRKKMIMTVNRKKLHHRRSQGVDLRKAVKMTLPKLRKPVSLRSANRARSHRKKLWKMFRNPRLCTTITRWKLPRLTRVERRKLRRGLRKRMGTSRRLIQYVDPSLIRSYGANFQCLVA